jgi:hypothetical protein
MVNQQAGRSILLLIAVLFSLVATLPEKAQPQSSGRGQSARDNSPKEKERRIALIIGNSGYAVKPLTNPANDAMDLGVALKNLGFDVTVKKDLDYKQMIRAIQDFGEQIKNGGIGLFFYAGHGAQVKGVNYLIPIGTNIVKESEIPLEAVDLGWVLAQMERASNRLNIIILDACRDNPFISEKRSSQRGLAAVTDVPVGTYISYSTAANRTAGDGAGRNSPYTESLLKHIRTPGLKVEDVFKRIRNEVRMKTQGEQVPWEYSAIEGDFYFAGTGAASQPSVDSSSPSQPPRKVPVEAGVPGREYKPIKPGESKTGTIAEQQKIEYIFDGFVNTPLLFTFFSETTPRYTTRYAAEIYNLRGQRLKRAMIYLVKGFELSFTPPADGQYIIRLIGENGSGRYTFRLSGT